MYERLPQQVITAVRTITFVIDQGKDRHLSRKKKKWSFKDHAKIYA
jgi:hypothetical protein